MNVIVFVIVMMLCTAIGLAKLPLSTSIILSFFVGVVGALLTEQGK